MIRVILAADHALVRAGLRVLLNDLPGVEVVGEADNGRDALELARRHRPDVALMDIGMPGLNGLDATVAMRRDVPGVRVVILSMHANEQYMLRALRAGAAGYVLKGARLAELELALRAVARGERYLAPELSKHIVDDYVRRGDDPDPLAQLTPRHREILQRIAEGSTNKEIAGKLGISLKTVEAHRTELMTRLDIHDVVGLVRYAIRAGLVTLD